MATNKCEAIRALIEQHYNTSRPVSGVLELHVEFEVESKEVSTHKARRAILGVLVPGTLNQALGDVAVKFQPVRDEDGQPTCYYTCDAHSDIVKSNFVNVAIDSVNEQCADLIAKGHPSFAGVTRVTVDTMLCRPIEPFAAEMSYPVHVPLD